MARFMSQADAIEMAQTYFPSFLRSREIAIRLSKWSEGKQYDLHSDSGTEFDTDPDDPMYGRTYAPRSESRTGEYDNLQSLAPNSFAGLIVATLAQTAYIEGIRRPGQGDSTLKAWETFRRNRWLARQAAVHRTAIGIGQAYGVVVPGFDPLTGGKMSRMLTRSPKRMSAFYDNDDDEWPTVAIEATPLYGEGALGRAFQIGWNVTLWDAYVAHHLTVKGQGLVGDDWTYIDHMEHNVPVPPVARCVNRLDLDGRTTGEIEPVLPILRRLDQDVFDRLINQRFGAWQVRYISGMAKPTSKSEQVAQAIKLRIEDILISTDPKTKFGTLPAGPLAPMIEATDADLRLLAAISQTPPHHLLGLSSNLQAEALTAASEGLYRKSFDFKNNASNFHEQMARLVSLADGDIETANAFDIQVRWRDTSSVSMSQAADALGKLAVQLKVPVEMLWEKIPGWTDDDVERAKELVETGAFEALLRELDVLGQADQGQTGASSGSGNA